MHTCVDICMHRGMQLADVSHPVSTCEGKPGDVLNCCSVQQESDLCCCNIRKGQNDDPLMPSNSEALSKLAWY